MLSPKRTKHRKAFKGRIRGLALRGNHVSFGSHGLLALEPGKITARQIEAARIAMTREIKRGGQVWIKIFPDKPISRKPAEVRMGSGKGSVEYYVAPVKAGRVLYEMGGVDAETAIKALTLAGSKLPIKTKIISKSGDNWN